MAVSAKPGTLSSDSGSIGNSAIGGSAGDHVNYAGVPKKTKHFISKKQGAEVTFSTIPAQVLDVIKSRLDTYIRDKTTPMSNTQDNRTMMFELPHQKSQDTGGVLFVVVAIRDRVVGTNYILLQTPKMLSTSDLIKGKVARLGGYYRDNDYDMTDVLKKTHLETPTSFVNDIGIQRTISQYLEGQGIIVDVAGIGSTLYYSQHTMTAEKVADMVLTNLIMSIDAITYLYAPPEMVVPTTFGQIMMGNVTFNASLEPTLGRSVILSNGSEIPAMWVYTLTGTTRVENQSTTRHVDREGYDSNSYNSCTIKVYFVPDIILTNRDELYQRERILIPINKVTIGVTGVELDTDVIDPIFFIIALAQLSSMRRKDTARLFLDSRVISRTASTLSLVDDHMSNSMNANLSNEKFFFDKINEDSTEELAAWFVLKINENPVHVYSMLPENTAMAVVMNYLTIQSSNNKEPIIEIPALAEIVLGRMATQLAGIEEKSQEPSQNAVNNWGQLIRYSFDNMYSATTNVGWLQSIASIKIDQIDTYLLGMSNAEKIAYLNLAVTDFMSPGASELLFLQNKTTTSWSAPYGVTIFPFSKEIEDLLQRIISVCNVPHIGELLPKSIYDRLVDNGNVNQSTHALFGADSGTNLKYADGRDGMNRGSSSIIGGRVISSSR